MPNQLIDVYPAEGSWNGIRMIYRQCEHVDRTRLANYHSVDSRCGGDASYVITQRGELTGIVFSLHLCMRHAGPYIKAFEQMESER